MLRAGIAKLGHINETQEERNRFASRPKFNVSDGWNHPTQKGKVDKMCLKKNDFDRLKTD